MSRGSSVTSERGLHMYHTRPVMRKEDWLAFGVLIGLLLVSQAVGDSASALLKITFDRLGITLNPWVAFASLALVPVVVLAGFLLTRSNPRPGTVTQGIGAALGLITLLLSSSAPGLVMGAIGVDRCSTACRIVQFAMLVVIWGGLWFSMLPLVQQWFQTPIDLGAGRNPRVPEGPVTLIALVSRITPEGLTLEPGRGVATVTTARNQATRTFVLTCESLSHDIEVLQDSNWPWQQLLRALNRYAPRAGLRVILVGSRTFDDTARGSHEQLETLCLPFLRRYPELREAAVTILPHALDFEDFNGVKDTIRKCIEAECRSRNVAEPNVIVDITGGQKVASAAAAAATIGTSGQFQYVQTNDPWDVLVSDLHPQVVPAVGG